MEQISRFFQEGGVWMYPLVAVSVFAFAVSMERVFYYYIHCRINAKALLTQITRHVRNGDVRKPGRSVPEPKPFCNSGICTLALSAAGTGSEIQNAIDEVALRELPRIQRRTHYLSLFANIATLLGLLGTIFGLQDAFGAPLQQTLSKASVLAKESL